MNERIQKLAEEAGWTDGYYESDDGPWIDPEFDKEKFAELIVKETMQVVANKLPGNVYLDVASAVIEHFESK